MIKSLKNIQNFFNCLVKTKFFPYLLIIFLSIPAYSFFLKPGIYWNMHDDMQMIRQLEFEKCLKDQQIPCRWTPDLGFGYGYPLFNFYPPFPYIVGQVFRFAHFDYMTTVKLTAILQFILAASFMYLLASTIFGRLGGFLSAMFYTYAPYHALNIFVRGAMNEAWASVFFPLILYFSRRLILEKKNKFIFGIALSFTGLMLSHNPMVLTFAPILVVWCLLWIILDFKPKTNIIQNIKLKIPTLIKLFLSALLSFGLAAFFTLPVLFETKLVSVETMFSGYYSFSAHFVSLYQLFISNFWGDGGSIWGPNDSMSFMIGYLHWIIPIIILLISFITLAKTKKINQKLLISLVFIFIGFFTAFMSHERSTFLWFIFSTIQKVQFPWRFLNHTTFAFSFAIGVIPYLLKNIFKLKLNLIKGISFIIFLAVFILNIKYFNPIHSGPLTDTDKFSGLNWERQITSGIYDYLPKTAQFAAKSQARDYIDDVSPNSSYQISGQKKGTDWTFFNISLTANSKLTLSQLAFPNFVVTDNNKNINYSIDPELGRIVLDLSSGNHQIYVKLNNTPIRTIANYISLFAWIFVFIYFSKPLWNKLILKK